MPSPPSQKGMYRRLYTVTFLFWGFFLQFLLLFWARRLFGRRRSEKWRRGLYRSQARRFKETAVELGGLLIKLGQFLSSRVDLMPREYIDELAGLQDQVAAVPFAWIARTLTAELGRPPDEVFAFFDENPEASASLGQVHRAVLPDGTEVAVKVLRPGIEAVVETDFRAIRFLLGLVGRFTSLGRQMDLEAIYEEFTRTTRAELDYRQEGRNLEEFRQNLGSFDFLDLPEMRWDFTTQRVMTMTFIHGIKITEYGALARAGLSRRQLAVRLIKVYLKMVMEDGFFHADPHPGNVFALPGSRVALVDFGMVGRITFSMKRQLRALFVGVANRRAGDIVRAFVNLHFIRPGADLGKIRQAVNLILDRFYDNTLDEIRSLDLNELGGELLDLVREHPFQVPASVAFLGRAIGTLVGLATGLEPDINLIDIFVPYAQTLVAGGEDDLLGVLPQKILRLGGAVAALPESLQRAATLLEQGDVKVGVNEMTGLIRTIREQGAATRRIGVVVYASALLLAATFLYVNNDQVLAGLALGFSLAAFIFAMIRR